tara:strand:- start:1350 stop:2201 length:852 start_codon:yes stop_codon:yes gene_type:complete
MFISGSIGLTILKNGKKTISILSDDHSNEIYCDRVVEDLENKEHIEIKDYLNSELNKGSLILLEEVPRDETELEELWPNTKHTQDLKKFFLDNRNEINPIIGLDIRPFLIPFSLDIINQDKKLLKILVSDYLIDLKNFFNLTGKFYNSYFNPLLNKIIFKSKNFGKILINLKKKFNSIMLKIKNQNLTLEDCIQNHELLLISILELCDEIMEFYTVLNCMIDNNNIIIHVGLFHGEKVINLLQNSFNFENIYKSGINNIDNIKSIRFDTRYVIPSCIESPKDL